MLRYLMLGLIVSGPLLLGCGPQSTNKPTYPVVGRVLVDGQPADYLAVNVEPADGKLDPEHPTVSSAFTDADGRFSLSTYVQGDGVPEGDYVLTFMWGQLNLISMNYGGPDKLKGRYQSPKDSKVRFTVSKSKQTLDLGDIELSTQ
jgi:hypothetical protein